MAGHSDTMRSAAVNAVAVTSGATYVAAHTADPGTTGAAEVTGGSYVRVQAIPPSAGPSSIGTTTFPAAVLNIPAGSTVRFWARYTVASGGTPYDSGAMPGAGVVFDISGTLTVNLTITQAA